jgi:hypothetical protein
MPAASVYAVPEPDIVPGNADPPGVLELRLQLSPVLANPKPVAQNSGELSLVVISTAPCPCWLTGIGIVLASRIDVITYAALTSLLTNLHAPPREVKMGIC